MVGDLRDECGKQGGKAGFSAATDLEDVMVIDDGGGDTGGGVGDEGEAEDIEAHMTGHDHLMHGGHADEGGTEGAEGTDLRGGLKRGTEDGEVDAFGEIEALPAGFRDGKGAKRGRVGGGHVKEAFCGAGAGGEAALVGTHGGVRAGEVDVIGDEDEGAWGVAGIDAAGGVGDEERPAAEQSENAGGEDDV